MQHGTLVEASRLKLALPGPLRIMFPRLGKMMSFSLSLLEVYLLLLPIARQQLRTLSLLRTLGAASAAPTQSRQKVAMHMGHLEARARREAQADWQIFGSDGRAQEPLARELLTMMSCLIRKMQLNLLPPLHLPTPLRRRQAYIQTCLLHT